METLVIFTNTSELADYGYRIFDIGPNKPAECIEVSDNKQFVIAFDGIQANDLSKVIDLIDEGSVYILYHSTPEKNILKIFKKKLQEKGITNENIQLKDDEHSSAKTYGRLRDFNNKGTHEEQEKIFNDLKFEIVVNLKLESLIHLHKSLSLIPLKVKNLDDDELQEQIDEFFNEFIEDDKYRLAFEMFKPTNFNSTNLDEKLNRIAETISKHSSN